MAPGWYFLASDLKRAAAWWGCDALALLDRVRAGERYLLHWGLCAAGAEDDARAMLRQQAEAERVQG